MTDNEQKMSFILVNDLYQPFSIAVHEQDLMRFSGISRSCNLSYHPVLSCPVSVICSGMGISHSCLRKMLV